MKHSFPRKDTIDIIMVACNSIHNNQVTHCIIERVEQNISYQYTRVHFKLETGWLISVYMQYTNYQTSRVEKIYFKISNQTLIIMCINIYAVIITFTNFPRSINLNLITIDLVQAVYSILQNLIFQPLLRLLMTKINDYNSFVKCALI